MTRLLALFRVTSSVTAVVLLIAVNLIPLAGVLWWGWNVYSLLVLYWIENGIVGVLNVARILRAEGAFAGSSWTVSVGGRTPVGNAALVGFFVLHYGIFWLVHGVFVFALPLFIGLGSMAGALVEGGPTFDPGALGASGPVDAGPRWDVIGWGALALAISHTASYVLNYIGRREYETVSPIAQTMAPYGRVVVLHLAIILGAVLSAMLGSAVGAVAVLVVVKTLIDLVLHLAEHRRAAARAASASRPTITGAIPADRIRAADAALEARPGAASAARAAAPESRREPG